MNIGQCFNEVFSLIIVEQIVHTYKDFSFLVLRNEPRAQASQPTMLPISCGPSQPFLFQEKILLSCSDSPQTCDPPALGLQEARIKGMCHYIQSLIGTRNTPVQDHPLGQRYESVVSMFLIYEKVSNFCIFEYSLFCLIRWFPSQ